MATRYVRHAAIALGLMLLPAIRKKKDAALEAG
jgi:hypothetical protein